MKEFKLKSNFKPTGDQPQAIDKLTAGVNVGLKHQVLLGATGTGKTFTIANIVQNIQKPTLVLAHNKTLAAQLASEFREYFPNNAVKYFVSYYDFYQPEAYVPRTDTYIEKQSTINEEIEKYRNSATQSLLSRNDVLIVASVSCIYGLGSPENYEKLSFEVKVGQVIERRRLLNRLIDIQYVRNDIDFTRGSFRVKGDVIDIFPSYEDYIYRIDLFGDEIDTIKQIDPITGQLLHTLDSVHVFPSKHYVTPNDVLLKRIPDIRNELKEQIKSLEKHGLELEARRLKQRTEYDIEMLEEVGYCNGVENYSRILEGREPGQAGSCLLDYFPDDYLMVIDESHITIPQVKGMYYGDQSRKKTLVDYGFRLPSALDNRPLNFNEFKKRVNQLIYVSATPSEYELLKSIQHTQKSLRPLLSKFQKNNKDTKLDILNTKTNKLNVEEMINRSKDDSQERQKKTSKLYNLLISKLTYDDYFTTGVAQQIIRPTGLLDPIVKVKPIIGQVKDLEQQILERVKRGERVLIVTLTKRMAEDLTTYLKENKYKVQYLHSDIDAIERVEILKSLRAGEYDIVVGINLLREGLDLPEVSLVAILDADKEGFLRNQTSLIQTIGRAARHINGKVIMYADVQTKSMKLAIEETSRRRKIQEKYNKKHNITPTPIIKKNITHLKSQKKVEMKKSEGKVKELTREKIYSQEELKSIIKDYKEKMKQAAEMLEFYKAAELRDIVIELEKLITK